MQLLYKELVATRTSATACYTFVFFSYLRFIRLVDPGFFISAVTIVYDYPSQYKIHRKNLTSNKNKIVFNSHQVLLSQQQLCLENNIKKLHWPNTSVKFKKHANIHSELLKSVTFFKIL